MKHLSDIKHEKSALGVAGAVVVVLLVAILAVGIYLYVPGIKPASSVTTVTQVTSITTGQSNVCNPVCYAYLNFSPYDPLGGAVVVSTVITVYPTAGSVVAGQMYSGLTASDSGTSASTGAGQLLTANQYTSGTNLIIKVAKTNFVTEYIPYTVPSITPAQQAGGTASAVTVKLNILTLGTGGFTVTDSAHNSYVSNTTKPKTGVVSTTTAANQASKYGTYNFTTSGTSSAAISVTEYNSAANTGWYSTQDILNNINTNLVLEVANANGTLSLSGLSPRVQIGSSYYWPTTLNDGYSPSAALACTQTPSLAPPYANCPVGFTTQTIGNNQAAGGSQQITFTINKGTLTAGQCQKIVFTGYDYANVGYFQSNGNYGPNSATLVSAFTIWACV